LSDGRLKSFLRVSKTTDVVNQLQLTADEIQYFVQNTSDFGNLDFNLLPVDPPPASDGKQVFTFLVALLEYGALRDGPGKGAIPLLQCFQALDPNARKEKIALLVGAKTEEVDAVVTQLGISDPALTQAAGLSQVLGLLSLARSIGATPAQLQTWSGEPSPSIV